MNRFYTSDLQKTLSDALDVMIEDATGWMKDQSNWIRRHFPTYVETLHVSPAILRMQIFRMCLNDRADEIRGHVSRICQAEGELDAKYGQWITHAAEDLDLYTNYIKTLKSSLSGGRIDGNAARNAKFGLSHKLLIKHLLDYLRRRGGPFCVVGPGIGIVSLVGAGVGLKNLVGLSASTSVGNETIGASMSGDLFSGKVEKKFGAEWDITKGNAGIEASIGAKGHIAKGKVEGHIGVASGEASVTVGEGSVKGSVGASLFKDGKFTPQLTAEAKAEVVGIKGEVKGQIGNDEFNTHVKATGEVGVATAKAKAGIGKITITDESGNTHTGFGAEGKVSAEAYAVKGKVSGGFTLFGIKIDASVEGKAGGAGVSAGGSVSTGGVSGEIGAGLGLGLGVKVSIDWSNFDVKKLKFW